MADIAKGIRKVVTELAEKVIEAEPETEPKTEPEAEPALVPEGAPDETAPPTPVAALEFPDGQVPLGSPFYVERSPIEADCFQAIINPSALIRIKAPRQVGKSSLMARVLDHAQQQGYRTVNLSFQEADGDIFESLEGLLQWLCASVAHTLGLPDQLANYWTGPLAKKQKCSNYLQDYIFAKVPVPLVLGMDEVDQVFQYPAIARDFFGLLRAWHEKKNTPTWQKLRLIITHSKEVYVPLDINQSPFNVGLAIELPEFTPEQVEDLAQRHGLYLQHQLKRLMQMLGGHPYLIRVALYALAKGRTTLEVFLAEAPTQAGPYGEHLRHHLENLVDHDALRSAMQTVVMANGPIRINDQAAFKLRSMGLIRLQGDTVEPLGDLYRLYFRDRLGGS
ncbi:MAG: AAA-like domain-containing protein [Leptolyngbya sp. SIO1E4]|nr:AAA-like domain-containing protein [Leptolyngbya sp. SIO1E4]